MQFIPLDLQEFLCICETAPKCGHVLSTVAAFDHPAAWTLKSLQDMIPRLCDLQKVQMKKLHLKQLFSSIFNSKLIKLCKLILSDH